MTGGLSFMPTSRMLRDTYVAQVSLPDKGQREAILRLSLRKHAAEGVEPRVPPPLLAPGAALCRIARRCEGFSGSDLVELCSQAASIPVHAYLAQRRTAPAAAAVGPDSTPGGQGEPRLGPHPMEAAAEPIV